MAFIEIIDRTDEGAEPLVQSSWDTIWVVGVDLGIGGCGDFDLADPELEPRNAGGLAAIDPLGSAIRIQLGCKRRKMEGMGEFPQAGRISGTNEFDQADMGGWHGDSYDIEEDHGEGPIGSWLWTLERRALTVETMRMAEYFAKEAMQTFIHQGVMSRVETSAEKDEVRGFLLINIRCYIEQQPNPYDIVVPAFPIYGGY